MINKETTVEKRKAGGESDPAVQHDIKSIGELLSKKRKEMNVSLKEIENTTSIRISYLQALEDGAVEKLISPIYAQGFFKQYASFLGIDGESIVRENPFVFNRAETQDFAYGIGTLEVRGNPGAGVKWFPNALWILAFLTVLVAAWYAAKMFGIF